jgi:hypothetical protein
MLRRAALVRTDSSEECITSTIRVIRIGELGTTLAITINRSTLQTKTVSIPRSHCRENLKSYIVLTGWSLRQRGNVFPVRYELDFYIPEDILHIHRRENLQPYVALTGWAL